MSSREGLIAGEGCGVKEGGGRCVMALVMYGIGGKAMASEDNGAVRHWQAVWNDMGVGVDCVTGTW